MIHSGAIEAYCNKVDQCGAQQLPGQPGSLLPLPSHYYDNYIINREGCLNNYFSHNFKQNSAHTMEPTYFVFRKLGKLL